MRPEIQTQGDGYCYRCATHFYGDNMSVIKNTSKPESTLKNKNNAVCYHAVKESVAMGKPLPLTYLVQKTQQTL